MSLGTLHRSLPVRVALCVLAMAGGCCGGVARADNPKKACVSASMDAQTLRNADKLLEARDKLRVCASDPCPAVVKARCAEWLGEVEPRIPSIILRPRDARGTDVLDATVTLDGQPASIGKPITVDPGEHVVAAQRAGGAAQESKFLVVDGDKSRVLEITFPSAAVGTAPVPTPASAPASAPSHGIPLGAWIVGGLGVVSLGASLAFFLSAVNDLNGLRSTCSPSCTSAQTQSGRTAAFVSDLTLGGGIAGVGVAVVWAIVSHDGTAGGAASKGPSFSSCQGELGTAQTCGGVAPFQFDVRPVAGGAVTTFGLRY